MSPSVFYLLTLHSGVRLSPIGQDRISQGIRAVVSPHATAVWRGVLCLSRVVAAIWVMTQHQDPGGYSLSSLPKASVPSLSSGVSNPLCPPHLCWSPGLAANKHWPYLFIYLLILDIGEGRKRERNINV